MKRIFDSSFKYTKLRSWRAQDFPDNRSAEHDSRCRFDHGSGDD